MTYGEDRVAEPGQILMDDFEFVGMVKEPPSRARCNALVVPGERLWRLAYWNHTFPVSINERQFCGVCRAELCDKVPSFSDRQAKARR